MHQVKPTAPKEGSATPSAPIQPAVPSQASMTAQSADPSQPAEPAQEEADGRTDVPVESTHPDEDGDREEHTCELCRCHISDTDWEVLTTPFSIIDQLGGR